MNTLSIFAITVLLSVATSFTVITLIKSRLHDMLVETCGTDKRAGFWVMYTQIMLVLSPLLIVIYLAPTASIIDVNTTYTIKNILFWSLLVTFIAMAKIGRVIWKSLNTATSEPFITHEDEIE